MLDQSGGPAAAAIPDAGRGGRVPGTGSSCRIVTDACTRPDTASYRLALSGPGQIEVVPPPPFRSGWNGATAR